MENEKIHLVVHHDACDAFWIPEELINVVITDNLVVVLFPPDKLAVLDFVSLVTDKSGRRNL